jgi:hypothetical protein
MIPYPTDNDLRRALDERATEFAELTGMSRSSIGVRALNDATAIDRIVDGGNFRVDTYTQLMAFMDRSQAASQPETVQADPDEEFEILDAAVRQRVRDVAASISYGPPQTGPRRSNAKQRGDRKLGESRLIVGLPTAAVIAWPFPQDRRFVIARGAKTVRILTCDSGGVPVLHSRNGGARFFFGHLAALGNAQHAKEFLPFRRLDPMQAGGAVIEIDSPAWLRAAG